VALATDPTEEEEAKCFSTWRNDAVDSVHKEVLKKFLEL
jgi:hypothetical protein